MQFYFYLQMKFIKVNAIIKIMATLDSLLADRTTSSELGFRINDKPFISADGKEALWANAWVNDKEGKLLCIGATVDTLEKMQAEGKDFDKLMLSEPETRIHSTNGIEYNLCQLYINDTIKISLEETSYKAENQSIYNKNLNLIMNGINQKLINSLLLGTITAIILGYFFCNQLYYKKGIEISFDTYINSYNKNSIIIKEAFNYKLAAVTFALVSGLMFFVFYDEKRNANIKTKVISLFRKYKSNTKLENHSFTEIKKDFVFMIYNLLFNFNGRISRINFLGEMLALNLVSYPFFMSLQNETNFFFKFIFLVIYLFFSVKINVRRLHDFNFTGWYSIIYLISIGTYLLALLTKWDFLMSIILSGWNVLFGVIIIYNLVLLVLPGNKFTNTYG